MRSLFVDVPNRIVTLCRKSKRRYSLTGFSIYDRVQKGKFPKNIYIYVHITVQKNDKHNNHVSKIPNCVKMWHLTRILRSYRQIHANGSPKESSQSPSSVEWKNRCKNVEKSEFYLGLPKFVLRDISRSLDSNRIISVSTLQKQRRVYNGL